jgi:glycosyltransferase involved in cell wall biosynthesis
MTNPLVSIIVNCYNGEEYLEHCLNSIFSQTYENWELIFWDNASTDNSFKVFNSYNDKRLKYFKSDVNTSLGQARAWAVNQCNGEYIAFLDVDDKWLPRKIEIQIAEMLKDESVLSYGSIIETYEKSDKEKLVIASHESNNNFKSNLLQFEIQMPTIMILKSALEKKKLNFDPSVTASEEYCLCMQLIYNDKVSVIKKPLAKYLVRKDSLTNKNSEFWAKERLYTLDKLLSDHPEIEELFFEEFNEAKARATYYEARHLMFAKDKINAIKKMNIIKFNSLRYFILYLIILLPNYFWNKIHLIKSGRG